MSKSGATPAGAMPQPKGPVAMTEPTTTPPTQPAGATPPTEPTPTPPPADGLGEAGKKALTDLRAENKVLAEQLKGLTEFQKRMADALGVAPARGQSAPDVATLTDQITAMQRDLADERLGRMREQIANGAKLPPELAARLRGSTREEIEADAAILAALIPASTPPASGTPAPDPTQGARGGGTELQARLAQAQKDGKTSEVIRIKTEMAELENKK